MAQNVEHQNLDRKLKAELGMEGIVGMAETTWEKTAVGTQMEMETEKKTVQAEKTMAKMEKRTVEMEKTVEGTRKTAAANEKTEWESLYQNRCNTHPMAGRTILYNSKKKKTNQEQERKLVHY
jgi:hypothetical protein